MKVNNILRENINKYKWEICVFLIVLFVHCIAMVLAKPLIQYVGGDEVGTIAGAAYFAGYDWKETMALHKYYGFGYSIFMTPFFWIFNNVSFIYGAMLLYNGVLNAITSIIMVRCMRRFCDDLRYISILSIGLSFIPLKFFSVINEHMLIFLVWVIAWILLRLTEVAEDKRKRLAYSIVLAVVMAYSLSVHTRSIIIWGAIFCAIVYYGITRHKLLVNLFAFLAVLGICGFLVQGSVTLLQNDLFSLQDREIVENTSDGLLEVTSRPKYDDISFDELIYLVVASISAVTTGGYVSFGMVILAIVFGIIVIIKGFRRHDVDSRASLIYVFCIAGIVASILGQVLLTMPDMDIVDAVNRHNVMFGKRINYYLRYYICYCGPILAGTFLYMRNDSEKCQGLFRTTFEIFIIGCSILVFLVADNMPKYSVTSSPTFHIWKLSSDVYGFDTLSIRGIGSLLIISIIGFGVICLLHAKKKYRFMAGVFSFWTMFQCIYILFTVDIPNSQKSYNENGILAGIIRESEEIPTIDKVLYIPAKYDDEYRLQFYLYDYKFVYEYPSSENESCLMLIRDDNLDEISIANMNYYVSDGNDGNIYFRSDELRCLLEEKNYVVYLINS